MSSRSNARGAEGVYAAARQWVDRALLEDGSLFTPGKRIWSRHWLEEIREHFLNQPDESDATFYQKLERQLRHSAPEVFQLMAEVLYMHFLIIGKKWMKGETKKEQINLVLEWSGQRSGIPKDLASNLEHGLIHPGAAYNIFRPWQVGFLIEFAEKWKEETSTTQRYLCQEPWAFKQFIQFRPTSRLLSTYEGDGAYRSQREVLLHLSFPDTFEPITNGDHKQLIVQGFNSFLTSDTKDIDRQLQQIRFALENDFGRGFSLYDNNIRLLWDPDAQPDKFPPKKPPTPIEDLKGSLPKYGDLKLPVLMAVHQLGGSATIAEVYRSVFAALGVTKRQQEAVYDNGLLIATHRIRSVADAHKSDGNLRLVDGIWSLSKEGLLTVVQELVCRLASKLFLPKDYLTEIHALLQEKKQVIFQGPPGTGKTYVAQKLAEHLAGSKERVTLVQFHPSYAYEDFVQGYRPSLVEGQPGFKLQDGPLLQAAQRARKEPNANHFLVIDEINRGYLAKVFGELYFLLEYRKEGMRLQYQADREFSLPENLWVIGTMNTADRSIALVDLALRRRFYFKEFHPDKEPINGLLRRWLKKNSPKMEWVADIVEETNRQLAKDRHIAIGPSYFMGIDEEENAVVRDEASVRRIWMHSVIPYIEEQLLGNLDSMEKWDLDTLRRQVKTPTQGSDTETGDPTKADASD